MQVLIIHAHPEPNSFNRALTDTAVKALGDQGHDVELSDLYAMNFNPVAGPDDVTQRLNPENFNLALEQGNAADNDLFADDIKSEIEKVRAADMLILQYPMWWFGPPAILKGWIDRVLAYKVAYGLGQWWDQGFFAGKKAFASITTGTPAPAYAPDGRNGDIERIMWNINAGVLRMCGYDVLQPQMSYGVAWADDATRQKALDDYAARLKNIENEEPVSFHNLDEFGEDMRLLPEIAPKTAGQHRP